MFLPLNADAGAEFVLLSLALLLPDQTRLDHKALAVPDHTETVTAGPRQEEVHAGRVGERGDAQQETFLPPVHHTPEQFLQVRPHTTT